MGVALQVECPVAHIDDQAGMGRVLGALTALHGPDYRFCTGQWSSGERWTGKQGRVVYRFVVDADGATVAGLPGEAIRGLPGDGPFVALSPELGVSTAPWAAALWPGDVVCLEAGSGLVVGGRGSYFEVETEASGYPAPRVAFLRYLPDKPGGCAAYPGAFRREAVPPVRAATGVEDQRGPNRVNEHTLDMRSDRDPPPSRHHHAPVAYGGGRWVNHSETAIVLPRSVYGLPEPEDKSGDRIRLYLRPADDPAEFVEVPVWPGSVVVTPATPDGVAGHCFVNAFAMLIAVPGFVSPYRYLP